MQLAFASVGVLLLILLLDKAPEAWGTFVPGRCQCPRLMERTPGRPLDFSVSPRNSHCHTDEIMVSMRGQAKLLCLSPSGRQGKRLLKCWRRVTRQGKDNKQCLKTPKNQKNQRNRKNQKNRRTQRRQQEEQRQ